jgi:hypothetical protein
MATGPEAPRRVTRCAARTEITASQLATLNALPDPIMPVSPRLCCELAAGHRDAHPRGGVGSECRNDHRHRSIGEGVSHIRRHKTLMPL